VTSVGFDLPPFMTARDIERTLGVSRGTSYEILHAAGPIRIGRLVRLQRADFLAWLEQQREAGAA
jgi:excisionase family DNA binding protein